MFVLLYCITFGSRGAGILVAVGSDLHRTVGVSCRRHLGGVLVRCHPLNEGMGNIRVRCNSDLRVVCFRSDARRSLTARLTGRCIVAEVVPIGPSGFGGVFRRR